MAKLVAVLSYNRMRPTVYRIIARRNESRPDIKDNAGELTFSSNSERTELNPQVSLKLQN